MLNQAGTTEVRVSGHPLGAAGRELASTGSCHQLGLHLSCPRGLSGGRDGRGSDRSEGLGAPIRYEPKATQAQLTAPGLRCHGVAVSHVATELETWLIQMRCECSTPTVQTECKILY